MKTPTAAPARTAWRTVVLACLAQTYFSLMFFVAAPLALLWVSGRALAVRGDALTALGLLIVLGANALVVWLVRQFVRQGRGTQVPIDPPRSIVATGVYARTRNPMYLAYVWTILGEALIARWWGLVVYALVFWAVFHAYVVLREEPLLAARFGEPYRQYRSAVRRWL